MDEREAKAILGEQTARLRKMSYTELRRFMGRDIFRLGPISIGTGENVETSEVVGESGARYVINIESFWDDRPNGDIRVLVEIQDLASCRTLTEDFIIAPDGSFVGE